MITRRGLITRAAKASLILATPALIIPDRLRAAPGNLAFPYGAVPRFDSSHIAARNPRFSGAMLGGPNAKLYTNLLTGQAGAITAPVTALTDGLVGPCFLTTGGGTISFPAPAANDATYTFACICRASISTNAYVISTDGAAANGIYFGPGNTNNWIVQAQLSGTFKTLLSRIINIAYFAAISFNSATTNAVSVNLQTGQIQSATTGSAVTVTGTPNGTMSTCLSNASTHLGPLMWSNTYLSLPELVYWAQDPWNYWYAR